MAGERKDGRCGSESRNRLLVRLRNERCFAIDYFNFVLYFSFGYTDITVVKNDKISENWRYLRMDRNVIGTIFNKREKEREEGEITREPNSSDGIRNRE